MKIKSIGTHFHIADPSAVRNGGSLENIYVFLTLLTTCQMLNNTMFWRFFYMLWCCYDMARLFTLLGEGKTLVFHSPKESDAELWLYFVKVSLNKQKQVSCMWFETDWRPCEVIVNCDISFGIPKQSFGQTLGRDQWDLGASSWRRGDKPIVPGDLFLHKIHTKYQLMWRYA